MESESSLLSSPVVGSDTQFEVHSDAHSLNSTLSTSSSNTDLRDQVYVEKMSVVPTSTSTSPPLQPPSSLVTKTAVEPGDFGLRATSFVPTPDAASRNDWVRLNMGGKIFATTR